MGTAMTKDFYLVNHCTYGLAAPMASQGLALGFIYRTVVQNQYARRTLRQFEKINFKVNIST
jgi:RNase P/RNase MRP subunit p30